MDEAFEVFISFKHRDREGRETADSRLAREIHRYLSDRGLKVFLSSVSLEQLGIAAYKKAIDAALDTAQVLIAVGTSAENVDSEWVRYEWDSFFNDMLSGMKPAGRVFAYIDGVGISSLPRALRQTQCIEHGPDALERLHRFVVNALGSSASPERGADVKPSIASTGEVLRCSNFLVAREPATGVSWNAAVKRAESLRAGGYSGWRLPSVEQLQEIREAELFGVGRFHSCAESGAQEAYYMNFEDGHLNTAPKTYGRGIDAIFVRAIE